MLFKKNILSHHCSYLEKWLLAEESCNFLYFTSSVEFQNTLLGEVDLFLLAVPLIISENNFQWFILKIYFKILLLP